MTNTIPKNDRLIEIAKKCGTYGRLDIDAENPDSNKLWIVFSHVNIPRGKFAQSNVLAVLDGHKLYLNCPKNNWYTKGISKFSSSLPSTIKKLLALSDVFEITFLGHSMGAYLSLVAGRSQSNVKYISTSPELRLGVEGSRSYDNNISGDGPWRDISTIGTILHDGAGVGVTYFGAYDPIDCYFLSQGVIDQIGQVYEVPHHHGITEYFTGNGIYHDILQAEKDTGIFKTLENCEHLYPVGHHGTRTQYRHFYETHLAFRQKTQLEQLRSMVSKYATWNNPGWQEIRAKIWASLKEPHLAMDAAEQAYFHQPNLMQFIDVYGLACVRYGERRRAVNLLDSLTNAQRKHPIGIRLLKRIEEKFGEVFRSRVTMDLEYRTVPVRITRRPDRSGASTEERPKSASELHEMNMAQKYDEVMEITSPLKNESFRYDEQLAPARAVALVQGGNAVSGIRLLRALSDRGHSDRYFARAVIGSAVKTNNVCLVEMYLRLNLDAGMCKAFSKILIRALNFVRSPMLIAQILAELGRHYPESLEKVFDSLSREKELLGHHYAVARIIPSIIDHADVDPMHRANFVKYMGRAGLRRVASSWLPEEFRTEEEAIIITSFQPMDGDRSLNTGDQD